MAGTPKDGLKWIRNPIKCKNAKKRERAQEHGKAIDWLDNFCYLSAYKLRRIFAKLEQLGLVISEKLRATKWDHCKYYTINQVKLTELLKSLSLPICSFLTNPFTKTEQMDLSSVHKSYQDTISIISLQDPEREPGAENKNWGEEKEASEDLTLRFDKEQDFVTQAKVSRSDKNSATVESGFESADCRPIKKGETVGNESQAVPGNDELREFQA